MWSSGWEDALFKRVPEGWTFKSPYPRILGRSSTYLLTDAEKARLVERLRRTLVMLRFLVLLVVMASVVLMSFWVPDSLVRLDAGSPGAWLLLSLAAVVLLSVLIPASAIAFYRVVRPVLCNARWMGPTQLDPPGAFQREVEFIKLQAEATSAKALIVRIGLGLLCVSGGLFAYVLLIPSGRGVLLLVVTVLLGLTAVWYAALLVVKLRAQRSAR